MHFRHTLLAMMTKIAITLPSETLNRLDALVERNLFPSRSRAIQQAVSEKLTNLSQHNFAAQCALLDASEEQMIAEEFSPEELKLWQSC